MQDNRAKSNNQKHEHYSGQLVSLPKKLLADHYVHDEIFREYNGTNALALAKKYGYTVSWIRKVVKSKKLEQNETLQENPAIL